MHSATIYRKSSTRPYWNACKVQRKERYPNTKVFYFPIFWIISLKYVNVPRVLHLSIILTGIKVRSSMVNCVPFEWNCGLYFKFKPTWNCRCQVYEISRWIREFRSINNDVITILECRDCSFFFFRIQRNINGKGIKSRNLCEWRSVYTTSFAVCFISIAMLLRARGVKLCERDLYGSW